MLGGMNHFVARRCGVGPVGAVGGTAVAEAARSPMALEQHDPSEICPQSLSMQRNMKKKNEIQTNSISYRSIYRSLLPGSKNICICFP